MLDEAHRAQFQKAFPQFSARLPSSGLKRLLDSCTQVDFHPGRNVFRDRMPTDALYFVLAGNAEIFVEKDERNIALGKIGAGALVGEISVLSRQMIASSTVQATTKMSTLKLAHQPLETLLTAEDTGPALLELLSDTLASRLRVPARAPA